MVCVGKRACGCIILSHYSLHQYLLSHTSVSSKKEICSVLIGFYSADHTYQPDKDTILFYAVSE